jgi:predicted SnoaL-like aldol condensation-catalyzing enzyme
MKKILLLAGVSFFTLLSCNNEKKAENNGLSTRAQKNLDAIHTVNKAFESGDAGSIDSVVDASFVDHTPDGDKNRDSLKNFIPQMKAADPTAKMETIQEFANDEYVAGWYRWTGTGNGSMGMPTGPYDMQAIEMVKFNADGKAIEHWSFMESREMMKMMKAMGGGNMGMDTTMKK